MGPLCLRQVRGCHNLGLYKMLDWKKFEFRKKVFVHVPKIACMDTLESKKANYILSDSDEHRSIGMSMGVWTVTSQRRTLSFGKLVLFSNIRNFLYLQLLVLLISTQMAF